MQIKIHRGTHQIGGTITEIKTLAARIIIDMGAELPSVDKIADKPFSIDGVTKGLADCDAVIITHYHGDHVGLFDYVLADIPIYMGITAKKIYSVVQQTLKKKLEKGNPDRVADFKTFEIGKSFVIKDIKITPYIIDHSAYDAYMLLIEAEGKRILHTGDFRMHGARGAKMPAVFEKYARNIDVLITEGTMLSRLDEKPMTEHEMGGVAKKIMQDNKNVCILCSSTNIDSIAEFYSAAISTNKPFIVCEDDFQLEILRIVTETAKSSFYNFSKQKIYYYSSNLHNMMRDRGFCFLGRTNYITQKALDAFPDNVLIYSMWRGYLDKKHSAYDRYKSSFIDKAVASGSRLEYLHTSGHATADDIKKVCDITQTKVIIPIHSDKPEMFKEMGVNGEVKILKDGEIVMV